MKTYSLVLASLLWSPVVAGAGEVFSPLTNGIGAKLEWAGTNTELDTHSDISYGFFTTTKGGDLIVLPKPEFLMRLRLTDRNGITIPMTARGAQISSNYLQLTAYAPEALDRFTGGSNDGTPRFVRLHTDSVSLRSLPPVGLLFRIPKPGVYELGCEFQVFRQLKLGTNISYELLRLPAVRVTVASNRTRDAVQKSNLPSSSKSETHNVRQDQ